MNAVRLVRQVRYGAARVGPALSLVQANRIIILALPICPVVSSSNAYQMGMKIGKVPLRKGHINLCSDVT